MSGKQKYYSYEDALRLMKRYCAYRERCHKEVEQRMQNLGWAGEMREKIMIRLIEEDFLNEERYARAYARGKFYINKWGRNRIVHNLISKGISSRNIEAGLTEIDETDYLDTLRQLIKKKKNEYAGTPSYVKKQKILRYMTDKGYEIDLILRECEQSTQ